MLAYPVHYPTDFATLVCPTTGKIVVCGTHCPRGMGVRMREVLACLWVGGFVPLALSLYYFQCSQIKFTLFFISYCIS